MPDLTPASQLLDLIGVIMLLYLKQAWDARLSRVLDSEADLVDAIREGAVLRVRPKAMPVAVIIAGLIRRRGVSTALP